MLFCLICNSITLWFESMLRWIVTLANHTLHQRSRVFALCGTARRYVCNYDGKKIFYMVILFQLDCVKKGRLSHKEEVHEKCTANSEKTHIRNTSG